MVICVPGREKCWLIGPAGRDRQVTGGRRTLVGLVVEAGEE